MRPLQIFWRFYWLFPIVAGILFNTVSHRPQLWSILFWTGVSAIIFGLCIAIIVNEPKHLVLERKHE